MLMRKRLDFIDLFAGGFNVAANVQANKTVCNDLNSKVVEMVRFLCYADEEALYFLYVFRYQDH